MNRKLWLAIAMAYFCGVSGTVATSEAIAETKQWSIDSENGLFQLILDSGSKVIPLQKLQQWTVTLKDSNGLPVSPARFSVSGGMPAHGHGLPSQPQVTSHLGDGVYRLEGLQFNMSGEWIVVLDITSKSTTDRAILEFSIEY